MQAGQFFLAESQVERQDGIGVGADVREPADRPVAAAGELDRVARDPHRAVAPLDLDEHVPHPDVLIVGQISRGKARPGGDAVLGQHLGCLELGFAAGPGFDGRPDEVVGAGIPVPPGGQLGVGQPVRPAHQPRQALQLMLTQRRHDEVTVGGPERAHHARPASVDRGSERPHLRVHVVDRDHRVEHRDIDPLAGAGLVPAPQRRQHPYRREDRGGHVAERPGDVRLQPRVRLAAHLVEPGHRLDHRRVGRPLTVGRRVKAAETGHGEVYRLRGRGRDRLVTEAETVHDPRPHVLGDHVELRRELQEQLPPLLLLQVDHQARFVEVRPGERGAVPGPVGGDEERHGGPSGLAARRLHLDNRGPQHRQ
jgi:hypothetical protein